MTSQEKVLEYAHKHNNSQFYKMTDQELAGKMIKEGVVIERTGISTITARIRREGKQLIITETTKTEVVTVENGKVMTTENVSTAEVDRINL